MPAGTSTRSDGEPEIDHMLSAAHEGALSAFEDEGFAILDDLLPPNLLALLRDTCAEMVAEVDDQIDAGGGELVRPLTHKGQRYFIDFLLSHKHAMRDVVFDQTLRTVASRVLLPQAAAHGSSERAPARCFHHKQQFVVKYPQVDMDFKWHQDSGYMWGQPHVPWITCWIALDDVSEHNGTLYILPHSRSEAARARQGTLAAVVPHQLAKDGTNDLIGYTGDEPGTPVVMKAGSVAVFASTTFHKSGKNFSDAPRRAYLCTYSLGEMELLRGTTRQNILVGLADVARGAATSTFPVTTERSSSHTPRL